MIIFGIIINKYVLPYYEKRLIYLRSKIKNYHPSSLSYFNLKQDIESIEKILSFDLFIIRLMIMIFIFLFIFLFVYSF